MAESLGGVGGGSNARPLVTKARAVPATINTEGAPIVVTRPNDTTAYTAGDVFGAAADARLSFAVPAPPATGVTGATYFLESISLLGDRSGANLLSGSPSFQPFLLFFTAQPATVIADNAPLALSDPDLALLVRLASSFVTAFTAFTMTSNGHNYGPAGKIKMASFINTLQPSSDLGAVGNILASWPTNTTIFFYVFLPAAFVPTAQEVLTITPRFRWNVVPT